MLLDQTEVYFPPEPYIYYDDQFRLKYLNIDLKHKYDWYIDFGTGISVRILIVDIGGLCEETKQLNLPRWLIEERNLKECIIDDTKIEPFLPLYNWRNI